MKTINKIKFTRENKVAFARKYFPSTVEFKTVKIHKMTSIFFFNSSNIKLGSVSWASNSNTMNVIQH